MRAGRRALAVGGRPGDGLQRAIGRACARAGWDELSLYGLHRRALRESGGQGAVFLVALNGWQVIGVSAGAIALVSRGGAQGLLEWRFGTSTRARVMGSYCRGILLLKLINRAEALP